eukprot:jgi/Bigna1/129427/aug1.9_g4135
MEETPESWLISLSLSQSFPYVATAVGVPAMAAVETVARAFASGDRSKLAGDLDEDRKKSIITADKARKVTAANVRNDDAARLRPKGP